MGQGLENKKLRDFKIAQYFHIRYITPLMAHVCQMCKSVDMNIWVRYANIHVYYELAVINRMTRNTMDRQPQ